MITGIGHVAFRVQDIERSKDFYCTRLGFRHAFNIERDGEIRIVYIHIAGDQFLELFPTPNAEPLPAGARPSYAHVQLMVSDLEQTLTELESRGIPRPETPPRQGRDGNWQSWLTDPDGNRIELMQMMPGSLQEQAATRLAAEARA